MVYTSSLRAMTLPGSVPLRRTRERGLLSGVTGKPVNQTMPPHSSPPATGEDADALVPDDRHVSDALNMRKTGNGTHPHYLKIPAQAAEGVRGATACSLSALQKCTIVPPHPSPLSPRARGVTVTFAGSSDSRVPFSFYEGGSVQGSEKRFPVWADPQGCAKAPTAARELLPAAAGTRSPLAF